MDTPDAPPAVDVRRLVNAWSDWDRACAEISRRGAAAAAKKPPRVYRPPAHALVREAAELVDAEVAAAAVLGIAEIRLVARIAAFRRDGKSIEEAVGAAISGGGA